MAEIQLVQRIKLNITRDDVDGISIKYIANTNDMFAVSRGGAVYSFSTKSGGKYIGTHGAYGYMTCSIVYADGKRKTEYIHRLVAEAFIPNPEGKKQVSHINEQKDDNRVENLSWSTSHENNNWGTHNEKLSESIREYWRNRDTFGKIAKRVVVMDSNGTVVYVAPSIQKAADYIKMETGKDDNSSSVQITGILHSKPGFKTVGGFKVREATEDEYKEWTTAYFNKMLQEESIELSKVQVNKLSKLDGVKVINRKIDMKTGEMSYEVSEFNKGEKITNELT